MYNLYHLIAKRGATWYWVGKVMCAQCAVCGRSARCVGAVRGVWAQGAVCGRRAPGMGAVRNVWVQCALERQLTLERQVCGRSAQCAVVHGAQAGSSS